MHADHHTKIQSCIYLINKGKEKTTLMSHSAHKERKKRREKR